MNGSESIKKLLLDKNQEEFLKKNFTPGVERVVIEAGNKKATITRNEFFQVPPYWVRTPERELYPVVWTKTDEVSHPIRYNPQAGTLLYQRFIYEINKNLSFRVIDLEKDLDRFSQWQNQPRVSEYWEQGGTKEEHRRYIEKNLADPHIIPAILEVDDESVGYFEFYWVKEDRLGPYYESSDFDRGFHFLIGEKGFLGVKNTNTALKCVVHYLFLDDPRTLKVMAEPNAANKKVLQYAESFPVWRRVKEFDFPHKRAVLLECTRKRLFTGDYL